MRGAIPIKISASPTQKELDQKKPDQKQSAIPFSAQRLIEHSQDLFWQQHFGFTPDIKKIILEYAELPNLELQPPLPTDLPCKTTFQSPSPTTCLSSGMHDLFIWATTDRLFFWNPSFLL